MKVIDFEFFGSNEIHPTLVCAAMSGRKYWLLDNQDTEILIKDIIENKEFLAYYAVAEARCFLALGLNPMDFKWVDLYVEFRMQQNSRNKMLYGPYLDKEGNRRISEPPILGDTEEEGNFTKVPSNLINAVFKNCGYEISSKEKHEMRDIILSKDYNLITNNKERILQYCLEDTTYLEPLYQAVVNDYESLGLRDFLPDMFARGRYAAATARCEQVGIPIDNTLLEKIIEKTPDILKESQQIVNNHLPLFVAAFTQPPKTFKNGKVHYYKEIPEHKDTKSLQSFIQSLNIAEWPKTESENPIFKTNKETLELYRYIPAIEVIYKHNKTESSLKWFNKNNGDGFFDAYGSDQCVRPFYGIFGTQTGRNAAKAKTFPLAMSKWLRAIIKPKPGWFIVVADFSQQEVAIAAELSGDVNLKNAYNSGDVYTYFAQQTGAIPPEGNKKSHSEIRSKYKATVLGKQFGMGIDKLLRKIRYDSHDQTIKREVAVELDRYHKTTFPQYWEYVYELSNKYDEGYPLITPDGWTLWQDNPVKTSIRNFPVQGTGASITRNAKVRAWEEGLTVMCTLHDAVNILTQNPTEDMKILENVMKESVKKILGKNSIDIRIDFKVISSKDTWIDEEGATEWEKIKIHLK